MFNDETYRAVIVKAMDLHGSTEGLAIVIKEAVGALIAADRTLMAYDRELWSSISETQKQTPDTEN